MTIRRYAVAEGDEIINVIMADIEEYTPPNGQTLIASEGGGPEIGWVKTGGVWINPHEQGESQDDDDYTGRDPAYIIEHATRSVQKRLDDFAKTRNYDGILSAATYAASTVPKFASEGQYAVNLRDSSWASLYSMMADVQAGTRAMPASYAEVESVLPPLEWPQ